MADIQVSGVNCRKKQKLDNMCTNSKKKRVTSLISEKVKSLGFVMKRGIFYKEIADGVFAVISNHFYSVTEKRCYELNTHVGLLVSSVERLRIELADNSEKEYLQKYPISTILIQIGLLIPERKEKVYQFSKDVDDAERIVAIWLSDIKQYAIPFFLEYGSIEGVFKLYLYKADGVIIRNREVYLPLFYYLMGEKEKGLHFLEETMTRYEASPEDRILQAKDLATGRLIEYEVLDLDADEIVKLLNDRSLLTVFEQKSHFFPAFASKYKDLIQSEQ